MPKLNRSSLLKSIESLEKRKRIYINTLSPQLTIERAKFKHFYDFVRGAWNHAGFGNTYIDGLPAKALAEHLDACFHREIRKLIINIPIRCGKSNILCALFQPWVWTLDEREQFLYTSYAEVFATRDHVYARRLILSPWYQSLWGHKVTLTADVNNKNRFDNTHGGFRTSASIKGSILGGGGDFLIIDDPNNVRDIHSPAYREHTNVVLHDRAFTTRYNNPNTCVRIISGQRLHENDLTGHILSSENAKEWTHLFLPMELETNRRCVTKWKTNGGTWKQWKDPRTKEGELLWPERINAKQLKSLKGELNSLYAIAGQLQQRPAPETGGLIKRDWFVIWEGLNPPDIDFVITSWDTALTSGKDSCYSAQTTWGVFRDQHDVPHVILLSAWRGKVDYPDLRKIAANFSRDYLYEPEIDGLNKIPIGLEADVTIIEAQVNGFSLIQDLKRAGVNVTPFKPKHYGNKMTRALQAASLIEAGRVVVPATPPEFRRLRKYADMLVTAASTFPNLESNDLVDSMSQALIKLHKGGWVKNPLDPEVQPEINIDLLSDKSLY